MAVLETALGKIIIREATFEDASETIEFMNWVTGEVKFHTYGANDFNIKHGHERKMISAFKGRSNCKFIVAELNGKIIGIATLSGGIKDRISHRGTIGITVSKRYWRLGIGNKMMELLIDFANNSRFLSKLELLVHEGNIPAIKLYEKLNFFEEGRVKRYFKINDKYYDGINMGLYVDGE